MDCKHGSIQSNGKLFFHVSYNQKIMLTYPKLISRSNQTTFWFSTWVNKDTDLDSNMMCKNKCAFIMQQELRMSSFIRHRLNNLKMKCDFRFILILLRFVDCILYFVINHSWRMKNEKFDVINFYFNHWAMKLLSDKCIRFQ